MGRTALPLVKLYGERNTGTNYLSRLLALNLQIAELRGSAPRWLQRLAARREWLLDGYFALTFGRNLGWKHALAKAPQELAALPIVQRELTFITLTKNPYSWLLSLYARPYHQHRAPREFHQFLVAPWPTVGREQAGTECTDPVDLWNRKNRAYMDLAQGLPTLNLTYEQLLADPERIVTDAAWRFSWRWKRAGFENLATSTKDGSKGFDDYRRYYLEEAWRAKLDGAAIDAINQRVDPQVMDFFGYARLD